MKRGSLITLNSKYKSVALWNKPVIGNPRNFVKSFEHTDVGLILDEEIVCGPNDRSDSVSWTKVLVLDQVGWIETRDTKVLNDHHPSSIPATV